MKIKAGQKIIDLIRGKKTGASKAESKLQIKYNLLTEKLSKFDLEGIFQTYALLADDYSKEMFIKVMQYRLTEAKNVLPPQKMYDQEILKTLKISDEMIKIWNFNLQLLDLNNLGYDVKVYNDPGGLKMGLGQYKYANDKISIKVEEGDYVIDGGACYGDTALYFAHDVGANGKVFSFEFLKDNVEMFNKMLDLNPELKNRIQLFKNALWENSNEHLYVIGNGPATNCSLEKPEKYDAQVQTKSIDDMVKEQNIEKINFIKLDIEGAELECLKGAKNTIQTFKPKLTVCLYHDQTHFVSIPKYLKQLVPEYDFYLDHHTESLGETVLYATIQGESNNG